jgi:hypothetical protein
MSYQNLSVNLQLPFHREGVMITLEYFLGV